MGFTEQHNDLSRRAVRIETHAFTFSRTSRHPLNFHVQRNMGCGGGINRSPGSDNGITLDLHPPSLPDKPLAAPILGQISGASCYVNL